MRRTSVAVTTRRTSAPLSVARLCARTTARAPAQSQNVVADMSMITKELRLTARISSSATSAALRMSTCSGSATIFSR
jgi:hypothetical protein